MDFFEAQEQSRQRSRRLLLWLIPALGFLFLGSHLIAVMAFRAIPYDLTGDFRQIYGDQRHGLGELFRHPRVIAASQIPILLTLIFTIGRKWRELSLGGGALLLEKLGARRLSYFASPAERRLKNVVEEVAIAAGTSVPVIFVLDREPSINALCAGFSPHEAVIGVTQGALEQLNRDELQGLVAHEFGHILNGDLVLNMRLVSLLNGALQISLAGLYLAVFGHAVLAFVVAYLGSTQGGALGMALAFLVTIVGALLLITGSVGMIGGRAAQMAVARERELLADAAAVQLARLNTGLAGALSKAGKELSGAGLKSHGASSLRHMLFQDGKPGWLATHPPIAERLQRLGNPQISTALPVRQAETRSHLQSLPAGFQAALENKAEARAVVYAVLMLEHNGEWAPQLQQLAGLDSPDLVVMAETLLAQLGGIDEKGARELINRAMPALQELDRVERARFLKTAESLAMGDGTITAFEEATLQLLRSGLMPARAAVSAKGESLQRALALIASAMAHAGHENASEAEESYAQAKRHLPEISELPLRARSNLKPWEFAKSLELVDMAPPETKKSLIMGIKAAALHDGVIGDQEQELLKIISQAIGAPVPETVYAGPWV